MPGRAPEIGTDPDSCRISGMLPITKVAANFHITAGKSIHHARGHSHMAMNVPLDGKPLAELVGRGTSTRTRTGAPVTARAPVASPPLPSSAWRTLTPF